ncbi:hypothetical protein ACFFMP_07795 [Pseudoroseomonas cervicalis]|uniref:hypothetical protein n=1 Tax=Teichococcus cervicalis TaxID=204525 RepID=UPI001FE0184E|nr:hypothetical protein [Pseudoroseomonas cervicalis]
MTRLGRHNAFKLALGAETVADALMIAAEAARLVRPRCAAEPFAVLPDSPGAEATPPMWWRPNTASRRSSRTRWN